MFTINKMLVVSAAVIATGLVAVSDFAQSRSPNAAAVVAARFPTQAEMLLVLPASEDEAVPMDKAVPGASGCTREHWPYLADECLTSAGGAKAKRPIRTIAIERVAANASAQFASR